MPLTNYTVHVAYWLHTTARVYELVAMSYDVTGRRKPTKPKKQARAQKRKRDDVDVEKLEQSVITLVWRPCSTFT